MSTAPNLSPRTAEETSTHRQQVEDAASVLPSPSSAFTVGILHDTDLDLLPEEGTIGTQISYADLPHFPASEGTLTTGTFDDTPVIELNQGLHLYDGHTPREVAFPVRMLATAGVDALFLTATAGSVNPQFGHGDLMLLTDHINFQGRNPLVGPNVADWGPRFPDMTEPYDPALRQQMGAVAREKGISLRKGIYLALLGPDEETAAEHRMAQRLGADAVGTSVVPEVIAARHMDVDVLALALLAEQHLADDGPTASAEDDAGLQASRSRLHHLLASLVAHVDTAEPAT